MNSNERINIIAYILIVFFTQRCIAIIEIIDSEANIPEDGKLNFTQLAVKYGRRVEEHRVTTEDNYIIQLFRLVGDVSKPLLMWHGIVDSSDTFILKGNESTSVVLNEAGYDVWLGNSRGNRYSRLHSQLNPDIDEKYWDFSFNETGYYDVSAAIDYILNKTGQSKLCGLGHSLGNTVFYVLAAMRPEYNEKIQLQISLAPIAYLSNLKQLARLLPTIWPLASAALGLVGSKELFRYKSFFNELIKLFCSAETVGYKLCYEAIIIPLVGQSASNLDPEMFKVVLGHIPVGTSKKVLDHLIQVANSGRFAQYDYGLGNNLVKYGSGLPPEFQLGNVKMQVALLYGANDNLATVEDAHRLKGNLPNVVYDSEISDPPFDHIDFNVGNYVNTILNPLLVKLLQQYGN